MDSLETTNLTGYESVINIRILYLKPDNEDKYYCYQYKIIDSKTLEIADIPLLVGGINAVKSTESLREEIKASSLKEDFKKDELSYKKTN